MAHADNLRAELGGLQRIGLAVGVLGLAATGFGFYKDGAEQFYQSWLAAFLYCLMIPMGALAFTQILHLTGGAWGFPIRRVLEGATRTLPLLLVAFVPVALGMHSIYEWSHPGITDTDPVIAHKALYLNERGFLIRAAIYFTIWIGIAYVQSWLSARSDQGDSAARKIGARIAAPALVTYVLTMTFASFDWAMSLEPHWYSTIYGVIFIIGQGLATLAFSILVTRWLQQRAPFSRWITADHFHDIGKLTFAFVLLYAYTNFSQFLIIWSANLAEETPWYLKRMTGGWKLLAECLIIGHFALPFLILLSRHVKRNMRAISAVAVGLLVMRFLDITWLIAPAPAHFDAANPHAAHFHWMNISATLGLFGVWFWFFIQQLKGRPLVSLQDAHLEGALEAQPHATTG